MKDWFYASGREIVCADKGLTKSTIVVTIRQGYKTIETLEKQLGVHFNASEREDVEYLLRIYAPMSYDSLSGCSGCDGCGGEGSLTSPKPLFAIQKEHVACSVLRSPELPG